MGGKKYGRKSQRASQKKKKTKAIYILFLGNNNIVRVAAAAAAPPISCVAVKRNIKNIFLYLFYALLSLSQLAS